MSLPKPGPVGEFPFEVRSGFNRMGTPVAAFPDKDSAKYFIEMTLIVASFMGGRKERLSITWLENTDSGGRKRYFEDYPSQEKAA